MSHWSDEQTNDPRYADEGSAGHDDDEWAMASAVKHKYTEQRYQDKAKD